VGLKITDKRRGDTVVTRSNFSRAYVVQFSPKEKTHSKEAESDFIHDAKKWRCHILIYGRLQNGKFHPFHAQVKRYC
jgi:tRNA A37 methylthiotransferase MiaB